MKFRNKTVGILAAPGYDDFQVLALARLLQHRDAEVLIVSVGDGSRLAVYGQSGSLLKPDTSLNQITSEDLDSLIIPGRRSQQELIGDDGVLTLIIGLNVEDKPIGAVGNGRLILSAAGVMDGKRVAADDSDSEKTDETGTISIDQDLVVDRNIVTARSGESLKHFIDVIAFLLEPAPNFS
jgi:protease I